VVNTWWNQSEVSRHFRDLTSYQNFESESSVIEISLRLNRIQGDYIKIIIKEIQPENMEWFGEDHYSCAGTTARLRMHTSFFLFLSNNNTDHGYLCSSSSICGAGTSAFEAVCTFNPVLIPPFISRGSPRQTAWGTSVSKMMNYGREIANFHVIAGFFNMPQSCDMGQKALLPLRRKACWGFCRPKNPTASAGLEPANLSTSMLITRLPKPLSSVLHVIQCCLVRRCKTLRRNFLPTCTG
jgi:hypothetical protein